MLGHNIIVIGASAGGLKYIRRLVGGFPEGMKASVFRDNLAKKNLSSGKHVLGVRNNFGIAFPLALSPIFRL